MTQQTLFDLTPYSIAELTGSHSDDLEDAASVKRHGKKSKFCPTWNMSIEEYEQYRKSYASTIQQIVRRWPPIKTEDF